jgi:flagellar biosynthetic protein FliQ
MNEGALLDLWQGCLSTITSVGAPLLTGALAIGLVTSVVQAATQLQENVLSFVPKLLGVGIIVALCGSWMLDRLVTYGQQSFALLIRIAEEVRP